MADIQGRFSMRCTSQDAPRNSQDAEDCIRRYVSDYQGCISQDVVLFLTWCVRNPDIGRRLRSVQAGTEFRYSFIVLADAVVWNGRYRSLRHQRSDGFDAVYGILNEIRNGVEPIHITLLPEKKSAYDRRYGSLEQSSSRP